MESQQFTVMGAAGFLGQNLVEHLSGLGHRVAAVTRSTMPERGANLGHVICAVGLTADFRLRPFDTIEAHVTFIADILQHFRFISFLYLSSTRVYRDTADTDERTVLRVKTDDPDSLYDLSKLTGETLCLNMPSNNVRVARLSNIYGRGDGSTNFLAQVIQEARSTQHVNIRLAPASAKDYLHVGNACAALCHIALNGRERIYNVACGRNVTNVEIAALIARYTGAQVTFGSGPAIIFPPISVRRLAAEMAWQPRQLADCFGELLQAGHDDRRAKGRPRSR